MKYLICILISCNIFVINILQAETIFTAPELVSISPIDTNGNGFSTRCQMNSDGNLVAFDSLATNLVIPSTPTSIRQVFLRDLNNQTTELISSNPVNTTAGNQNSEFASLSGDGRFVVFHSLATNLVTEDTNNKIDVFISDRQAPTAIRKVSLGAVNTSLAEGDNDSYYPDISDDGQRVVFLTLASNLVTTDSDVYSDIYLKDFEDDSITRLTTSTTGGTPNGSSFVGSPAISGDGQFVVFGSYASNLIAGDNNAKADIFVQEIATGFREIINLPPVGDSFAGTDVPIAMGPNSISADGRFVGFGLDTDLDSYPDKLYLRDRLNQTTSLVSKNIAGVSSNNYADYLQISADANSILFYSPASNLVETSPNGGTFVFDRLANELNILANQSSDEPCLSPDGNNIAYSLPDSDSIFQIYTTTKDLCPEDSLKTNPGTCGCGTADSDQDQDGTPDCNDQCATDPAKTTPQICGCGISDADEALDNIPDCFNKTGDGSLPAPIVTLNKQVININLIDLEAKNLKFKLKIVNTKTKETFFFVTKKPNSKIRFLPKGTYQLRYQLINEKKKTKSKFSSAIKFTIKKDPKSDALPNIKGIN